MSHQEKFLEDYIIGSIRTFGSILVREEDIIAFARSYDPQVFHIDPVEARKTVYGGLVASGWHTGSMAMRLFAEHFLSQSSSMGSPGVDELRWLKPVRPGDRLSLRVSVLKSRRSESKPDRGIIKSLVEVLNQDEIVVMRFKALNIILSRR